MENEKHSVSACHLSPHPYSTSVFHLFINAKQQCSPPCTTPCSSHWWPTEGVVTLDLTPLGLNMITVQGTWKASSFHVLFLFNKTQNPWLSFSWDSECISGLVYRQSIDRQRLVFMLCIFTLWWNYNSWLTCISTNIYFHYNRAN